MSEITIGTSRPGHFFIKTKKITVYFTGAEIRPEGGCITFYKHSKSCAEMKTKHLSEENIEKIKELVRSRYDE